MTLNPIRVVLVFFLYLDLFAILKYTQIFNYLPYRNILLVLALALLVVCYRQVNNNLLMWTISTVLVLLSCKILGHILFWDTPSNIDINTKYFIQEVIVFLIIILSILIHTSNQTYDNLSKALESPWLRKHFQIVLTIAFCAAVIIKYFGEHRVYGGDFLGLFAIYFGLKSSNRSVLFLYAFMFLLMESRGYFLVLGVAGVLQIFCTREGSLVAFKPMLVGMGALIVISFAYVYAPLSLRNQAAFLSGGADIREALMSLDYIAGGRIKEIIFLYKQNDVKILFGSYFGSYWVEPDSMKGLHLSHSLFFNIFLRFGLLGGSIYFLYIIVLTRKISNMVIVTNKMRIFVLSVLLYANLEFSVVLFPLISGLAMNLSMPKHIRSDIG